MRSVPDDMVDSLELYAVVPRSLFLRLRTRAGLEGWGEPMVEGRAGTVAQAVCEMGAFLVGKTPDRIEDVWQTRYRGGPVLMSAVAGIDQGLWHMNRETAGGSRIRVFRWRSA